MASVDSDPLWPRPRVAVRWDHDHDGTLRRCGGSCGRRGGTGAFEGCERRGRPKAVRGSICQYLDYGRRFVLGDWINKPRP